MRKTIKNKILIPLVILFTLSMALLGIFSLKTTNSANADFNVTDTQVRVEEIENGRKGMRFVSTISKDIVKGYTDNGYTLTYGTFIMPAHYATDPDHGEINEDNIFGESAKYVWGNASEVDGKWWILHVPGAIEEVDADNYEIKASVNMNVTGNWGIKYTSKAYLKAVKADVETEYVFATSATDNVSMLDVAVDAMDTADSDLKTVLDGFVSGYKAAGKSVDVAYSIVQKYDEVEVETTGTAEMGTVLDVAEYKNPTADTEETARYDERYFYFADQNLGSLRVKADGSTRIVIDFSDKAVYTNAKAVWLPLNKLNDDSTGNVPYADSYEVAMDSDDKVASLVRSDFDTLSKGYVHTVKKFPTTENVVYEVKIKPITAFIETQNDMKHIRELGNYDTYTISQGDYFVAKNDIDMTGYTRGFGVGTGYPGSSSYTTHGFRGRFDGDGHVFYNLSSTLIDVLGYSSELRNLTVIGTGLTGQIGNSVSLITRANYGSIINCHFDITSPDTVSSFTCNYPHTGLVFNHMNTYNVNGVGSVTPVVVNTVIRIHGINNIGSTLFGDSSTGRFENTYVYTDSDNAFYSAPTEGNTPVIAGLNDAFTGDASAFGSMWSFDSKLPALYGRVISHADTTYASYRLNDSKNGRVANGDKTVVADDITYTVPQAKLLSQATGKATHFVTSGDDFGFITVDKVTALVNDADDLENILYLAGGGTDACIVDTNYDKFGADELFVLTTNIDMTGRTPVQGKTTGTGGTYGKYGFHGILDGKGYTVTNLNAPLFANLGSAGVVKNLSVVADNAVERMFLHHNYGLVDNCYLDYTASTALSALLTNYAYGSSWKNCVIKVNSLSTVSGRPQTTNTTAFATTVQSWNMQNTIVMTNSPSWYGSVGNEGLKVAPTVVGLDGITASIASNFMENGGNADVWTADLTFKNFNVVENLDGAWARYVYTDANCTARTANTAGYSDIDVASLSALNDGSIYLKSTLNNGSLTRDMVRVATIVAYQPKELSQMLIGCGGTSGQAARFTGYVVVGADLDMTGTSFALTQSAWSGHHYDDRAFDGVLDGNNKTVSHLSSLICLNLGGVYGAVIKDLKLEAAHKSIAGTLGKATIENCVLDFELTALAYHGSAAVYGVIADNLYVGKTATIKNTTIKVLNMISGTNMYVVENNNVDSGTAGVLVFDNVTVLADQSNVLATAFDTATSPTFGENSKKFYTEAETFYYGRYAFDPTVKAAYNGTDTTVPAAVANTFGVLSGSFKSNGERFTLTNVLSLLGFSNPETQISYSFGIHKSGVIVRDDSGSYHTINIGGCWFAITDEYDARFAMRGLRVDNWQQPGITQTIGFNTDVDMEGIVTSNPIAGFDGGYGHKGIFEGNGRTVYNLESTLFGEMNYNGGTLRNLNFVNMKATASVYYHSAGGTFDNVNFDIDASGMDKIFLISNNPNYKPRNATNFNNSTITIRNASDGFVCYMIRDLEPTYSPGSITLTNVTVNMNAGTFKLTPSAPAHLTGEQVGTVIESVTYPTPAA